MGAWGSEPFDNDDAGDWVYELEEEKGHALLAKTLEAITSMATKGSVPEASACSCAIAAAEVVAALGSQQGETELPEEVLAWIEGKAAPSTELVQQALAALDLIAKRSELQELWQEQDSLDEWRQTLSDLSKRLRAI